MTSLLTHKYDDEFVKVVRPVLDHAGSPLLKPNRGKGGGGGGGRYE